MKTIITDKITIGDVKKWIAKCNSIHNLQMIRTKANKRMTFILIPKKESPFKDIPIEKKREIISELFVKEED